MDTTELTTVGPEKGTLSVSQGKASRGIRLPAPSPGDSDSQLCGAPSCSPKPRELFLTQPPDGLQGVLAGPQPQPWLLCALVT